MLCILFSSCLQKVCFNVGILAAWTFCVLVCLGVCVSWVFDLFFYINFRKFSTMISLIIFYHYLSIFAFEICKWLIFSHSSWVQCFWFCFKVLFVSLSVYIISLDLLLRALTLQFYQIYLWDHRQPPLPLNCVFLFWAF